MSSDKRHSDLIDRLRRNRAARTEKPLPARGEHRVGAYDFSRLPDYQQLNLHRAAAEALGIDNPFFRAHDGRAGTTTTIAGRILINFASYDYLGCNNHPDVMAAATEAIALYGTSVSASRIVAGERRLHRELEAALAEHHGVEDAITFVSGHATNVSTIGTLMNSRDLLLMDELIHNSIFEGARLSGATRLTFPHNDWAALDRMLAEMRGRFDNVLIAIEGLYSMDGDAPDLAQFVSVKQRHRAWLMVDEAHSLGVMGTLGRGVAEAQSVDPKSVEIWMGTLSKTLASCGGYIAGSGALVDYLKTKVPGFVYSVGLSPPLAASALKALEVVRREPDRIERLATNGAQFLAGARAAGLNTGSSLGLSIVPIFVGDSAKAAVLSDRLAKAGINALPIIYPAVPENLARIRFFITSEHQPAQIDKAARLTAETLRDLEETWSTVLTRLSFAETPR